MRAQVTADLILKYMVAMSRDKKIKVMHMAVVFAILQIAIKDDSEKAVSISRKKVMETAHIGSISTYHKYLKDLEKMGYIKYSPSYHPMEGSTVFLNL